MAANGVFDDQTTDAAKACLAAASSIDDIPFATTVSNVEHKIEGQAVLLLKTVDDGRAALAKDIRGCPLLSISTRRLFRRSSLVTSSLASLPSSAPRPTFTLTM